MSGITLIVADDHPLFRQGVVRSLSLEPAFKVLAEAADGKAALQLIEKMKPDIAILDVNMPEINGQRVVYHVASEKLPTRVILLTGYDDPEQILHAAMAGAWGFCSKDIAPEKLIETIKKVAAGFYVMDERVLSPDEFKRWRSQRIKSLARPYSEPGRPFTPLSDREMQVLECIVRGMSNKEIAAELCISHQTVKNHITSILRKFSVDDRTQAVVYALKQGWIDLQDL